MTETTPVCPRFSEVEDTADDEILIIAHNHPNLLLPGFRSGGMVVYVYIRALLSRFIKVMSVPMSYNLINTTKAERAQHLTAN